MRSFGTLSRSFFARTSPHALALPLEEVEQIIRDSGASDWFVWAIKNRPSRGEAVAAMNWIVANVDRPTPIFETGCGCAANLIWLGQQGYLTLAGRDVSVEAINAGKKLAALAGLSIDLGQDDSTAPSEPIPSAGVLLGINWMYFLGDFRLQRFLELYRAALRPQGFVIFDMVDSAFNDIPKNEHRTDDWSLPEASRRPTQYKIRMTRHEVRQIAGDCGFDVVATMHGTDVPPRFVTVLRQRRSA